MSTDIRIIIDKFSNRSLNFFNVLKEFDERLLEYIEYYDIENDYYETIHKKIKKDDEFKFLYESFGFDFARVVLPALAINNEEIYIHTNSIASRLLSLGFNIPKDLGSYVYEDRKSSKGKVAFLVPHRDRYYVTPETINKIKKFLIKHQSDLEYNIFILNQEDNNLFNRGQLLNAGINLLDDSYSHFVPHDADIFPVLADFKKPNKTLFRVTDKNWSLSVVLTEDAKKVNGFPNNYWGWGYEDNEFENRFWFLEIPYEYRDFLYDEVSHEKANNNTIHLNNRNNFFNYALLNDENKISYINNNGLFSCPSEVLSKELIEENVYFVRIKTNDYLWWNQENGLSSLAE